MNSNSITTILEIFENEPHISHRIIAENTDNLEVSVQNLINKHKNKFELFGRIHFENESETSVKFKQKAKPNYRAEKTFYLNEQQATLLLTFMRNNEIVINFKIRLVKEFFEMRQLLLNSKKKFLNQFKLHKLLIVLILHNKLKKIEKFSNLLS